MPIFIFELSKRKDLLHASQRRRGPYPEPLSHLAS
jgi:hypothetical protein